MISSTSSGGSAVMEVCCRTWRPVTSYVIIRHHCNIFYLDDGARNQYSGTTTDREPWESGDVSSAFLLVLLSSSTGWCDFLQHLHVRLRPVTQQEISKINRGRSTRAFCWRHAQLSHEQLDIKLRCAVDIPVLTGLYTYSHIYSISSFMMTTMT